MLVSASPLASKPSLAGPKGVSDLVNLLRSACVLRAENVAQMALSVASDFDLPGSLICTNLNCCMYVQ